MSVRAAPLIEACAEAVHATEQARLAVIGTPRNHPWAELPPEAQERVRDHVRKVLLGEVERPAPDARPGEELAFEVILAMARALGFSVAPVAVVEPPTTKQVAAVRRAVAERTGQTVAAILSASRSPSIALARHLAFYLCRTRLHMSSVEIGRAFGGRDHTTVLGAVRKIERDLPRDAALRAHLDAITAALDNPT